MKGKGWAAIVQEKLSPWRKEYDTEENGKSNHLKTAWWQNHFQVVSWLMCHVEVRYFVFSIIRNFQSHASMWEKRQSVSRLILNSRQHLSKCGLHCCPFLRLLYLLFPLFHGSMSSLLHCLTMTAYSPDKCSHHSGLWTSTMRYVQC